MENLQINLICYWHNRIKNGSGVFERFFLCRVGINLFQINKKSLTMFEKKDTWKK